MHLRHTDPVITEATKNDGVRYTRIRSPAGEILVGVQGGDLVCVSFQDGPEPVVPPSDWRCRPDLEHPVLEQLEAYFAGRRTPFDVPLRLQGTPFQLRVWRALVDIPLGTTLTYRQLAAEVGNPRAFRAVGAASARNPVPIVIPCHRVIGSDGTLTGFRGGVDLKAFLLEHESNPVSGG